MTNKPNGVRVSIAQVFKAVNYANDHPDSYLSGTTNWCAAVAFALNRQIIDAQPADQQGAPVAWLDEDSGALATAKLKTCIEDGFEIPLYRHAQPATAKVDEHKLNIVVDKVDDICEKFEMEGLHSQPTYKQFKRLHAELARAKLNTQQ